MIAPPATDGPEAQIITPPDADEVSALVIPPHGAEQLKAPVVTDAAGISYRGKQWMLAGTQVCFTSGTS